MTTILLDTNVLSELVIPRPDHRVIAFVQGQTDAVVSVVTVHELVYGAERVRRSTRRAELLAWISSMRNQFAARIIDIDSDIAERAGQLRAAAEASGHRSEAMDALIAASAIARGATVATRNIRDFLPLGVKVVNPWLA